VNILGINGSDKPSNMEGPKRLEFTTLGPPGKPEKKDVTPKTYRFDLDIPESTDTTCPEFFYTELLKTIPVSHQNVLAECSNDFSINFNKEIITFHIFLCKNID
jgi:hypothetical protein